MDQSSHVIISQSPSPSMMTINNTPNKSSTTLSFNTIVILASMSCALVCALGLHSLLRCVVSCTVRAVTEPVEWAASRRMNSGLNKKDMGALPTSTYAKSGSESPPSTSRCAICLIDYSEGDDIRVLPKCNHRFHVACVDTWLLSHSSCPTCRCQLKDDHPGSLAV